MAVERGRCLGFQPRIGIAGAVALEFDMELDAGRYEGFADVVERGNGIAIAVLEHDGAVFAGAETGNRSRPIGGAIERRIVNDQQLSRFGQMDVEFDAFHRHRCQVAETGYAVFRPEIATTPVADDIYHLKMLFS
ncbi:hypothetical protein D3C87_1807150 [compost metagenome]